MKKQVKQGEEANQPAQVKTVRVVEQRVSHFAIGVSVDHMTSRTLLKTHMLAAHRGDNDASIIGCVVREIASFAVGVYYADFVSGG